MSDYTVTNEQLGVWIGDKYGIGPVLGSPTYICPTRQWVLDVFGPAWKDTLEKLGLHYQEGAFDCQSFTLACVAVARICHSRNTERPDPTAALAMGGCGFTRWSTGKRHKIVLAFEKKGDVFAPIYLEPQSGKEFNMYPEEENSIMEIDLL